MHDIKKLGQVVVLGAAGKMGSGIALLLLQEIVDQENSRLTLVDSNIQACVGLKHYLQEHLVKFAERRINALRQRYSSRSDLVDNVDIIDAFVMQAMDRIRLVSSLEECQDADLIFEAIIEDVEAKATVLRRLNTIAKKDALYFTNTSSIPISVLQKKSGLDKRLVGFHFYNPPAIQQLLEIVFPDNIDNHFRTFSLQLAKQLKKTVVLSKDIAGFIGNGHFIREILYAGERMRELSLAMPPVQAIFNINRVTQEFLLRPMGIFQLIDYVGIDVGQHIAALMSHYLPPHNFVEPLVKEMLALGIKGGQQPDGSQKEGFFRYDKGKPIEIFDLSQKKYLSCQHPDWIAHSQKFLGELPVKLTWKLLSKDEQRAEKILSYFKAMAQQNSQGTMLATDFLEKSRAIAHGLVDDGVAVTIHDVDTVLQKGFFHLYGVDEYFLVGR